MAEGDIGAILTIIADISHFRMLPERLHQGMLEALLLGRAMRERFTSLDEISQRGISIDKARFYYSGISQGGIYGGTYMALTTDVVRGHLGVPGQNYSLLMPRSVDFTGYFSMMQLTYETSMRRAVSLAAGQSLWDTTDPSSYYRHITAEPFEGNQPHHVLLASAQGDWQVALLSNEITARTEALGVQVMKDYGKPLLGIAEQPYPYVGSGLVNYRFGNPWPSPGNLPPDDELGDPHGKPRKLDHHNLQMVHFFDTGEIIDVCGGDGCTPE